ncbi:uncharacterized protein LOC108679413 [Hyalella azteca]|uniref:Uncharacterized protein LOC108679413 n=1 Tax=Hyalella azteca TaxID=294128 RepID=A0A8B7PBZ0_HYAAZ|nr:uncharacterized protein LOC108679413 [Hyalella azteca]
MGRVCVVIVIVIVVVACVIGGAVGIFAALRDKIWPYPLHANCQVDWTFGKPCSEVETLLVQQLQQWSEEVCDAPKDHCGYNFLGVRDGLISGAHFTPSPRFRDTISFNLTTSADGCNVRGKSRSDVWYAINDFGVNYCNIKDLVVGARLASNDPKHTEKSQPNICTQYPNSNCTWYN